MPELIEIAKKHQLKMITIKDLIQYRYNLTTLVEREVDITAPTDFGTFKVYGYTNEVDGKEHVAFVMGDVPFGEEPVLVRVHSECLTGDVFGSHRCDCGPAVRSRAEPNCRRRPWSASVLAPRRTRHRFNQ